MAPTSTHENKLDDVETYHEYHDEQIKEASNMLRKYDKLNWNKYHMAMDIGCGPADYTHNYLLPLLPPDAQIIAIDKSTRMIEYARSNYENDRLKFDIMDIGNQNQAKRYRQTFDMIFSSYCLHWLPNQRAAMKNIYTMLKNGGDFITVFVADTPLYPLIDAIMAMDKWKKYTMDSNLQFAYQNDPNPEKTLNTILTSLGFSVHECVISGISYMIPSSEVLIKSIYAIISLELHLPEDLVDEFNADCLSIMKTNRKSFSFHENGTIVVRYSVFNIHCSKHTEINNSDLLN